MKYFEHDVLQDNLIITYDNPGDNFVHHDHYVDEKYIIWIT